MNHIRRAFTLIEALIVVAIIGILLAIFFGRGCSDYDGARSALQNSGFSDIKLDSPRRIFTGCGEAERVNHPFTATSPVTKEFPNGRPVSGTVCCGGPLSWKSCTVRF
jgi:prepilin-type N-terminal cleavage/methylation domain-containing protein